MYTALLAAALAVVPSPCTRLRSGTDTLAHRMGNRYDRPDGLLNSDKLYDFLQQKQYQGKPLVGRLGGWMKESEVFRGKEVACYHKEWAYFSNRYKVTCAEYIEAKWGIPPTPGHVQEVIALMKERKIPMLFASNYFDRNQIRQVAQSLHAVDSRVRRAA